MKKYVVRLDAAERADLERIVRKGKRSALVIRRANILLAVDESDAGAKMKDVDAARAFGAAVRSVEYLRRRLVEEGLEAALERKKQARPSVERMFDGEKEAKLMTLACSQAPAGQARWTMRATATSSCGTPSRRRTRMAAAAS